MENWHLLTAAFILSVVDLSVLGSFLWYQLSTFYFAWHLCPMIVNRICELIAFLFTGGMLPSLFAVVQVFLSLFSTSIYAKRHQHVQSKLLLAVYCTLLLYEVLVALLLVKMGRYVKHPGSIGLHHSRSLSLPGRQAPPYIAFHMFALLTQPLGTGCSHPSYHERQQQGNQLDGFVTVQQPDGKKVMLGKVVQSKVERSMKEKSEDTDEGMLGKETDVRIHVSSRSVPDDGEHASNGGLQLLNSPVRGRLSERIPAFLSESDKENDRDTLTSLSGVLPKGQEHFSVEMPVL